MADDDKVRDERHPCPNCGKAEFVWGHLGAVDAGKTTFYADDRSMADRITGTGQGPVRTRLCLGCRHLDLFATEVRL